MGLGPADSELASVTTAISGLAATDQIPAAHDPYGGASRFRQLEPAGLTGLVRRRPDNQLVLTEPGLREAIRVTEAYVPRPAGVLARAPG